MPFKFFLRKLFEKQAEGFATRKRGLVNQIHSHRKRLSVLRRITAGEQHTKNMFLILLVYAVGFRPLFIISVSTVHSPPHNSPALGRSLASGFPLNQICVCIYGMILCIMSECELKHISNRPIAMSFGGRKCLSGHGKHHLLPTKKETQYRQTSTGFRIFHGKMVRTRKHYRPSPQSISLFHILTQIARDGGAYTFPLWRTNVLRCDVGVFDVGACDVETDFSQ